jgi:hypothetical protein
MVGGGCNGGRSIYRLTAAIPENGVPKRRDAAYTRRVALGTAF